MALFTTSFGTFTDSGLLTSFSGNFNFTEYTDASEGILLFNFYIGSNAVSHYLQAASAPGVANITITPTDILPSWQSSRAYTVGQCVQPSSPNGYKYQCSIAGTSGGSAPSFPTSGIGSTFTDGTVTWTFIGAKHLITQCKLALTSGAVAGATAGAALNVATNINSGVSNAIQIFGSSTNSVSNISNSSSVPDWALQINSVTEFGS